MNHWAYDAIGQLAAHGILSGYPDGTYKGQQSTTRYEMASALARALAVVDMTKASKQDVEMLKRLVVEFKDELEALGVRVDELDERVAVLEDRLGGWHMHGTLVLDVQNESRNDAGDAIGPDGKGSVGFDEARIWFERRFGENEDYFFAARLRDEEGGNGRLDRFFVEMPFFFDTKMTVGRFNWALEGDYKISLPGTGVWDGDQILTDWTMTGFGVTKNFGLGMARVVFAHPSDRWSIGGRITDRNGNFYGSQTTVFDLWMILPQVTLQFTEQIGLDLGAQVFVGDNAEQFTGLDNNGDITEHRIGDVSFNNLWTVYGGLRFNFNDAIGFKGVFYHQEMDTEMVYRDPNDGLLKWMDTGSLLLDANNNIIDDANHWAAILDVKQQALKFTSLWLEYGQYDRGFWGNNTGILFYGDLLKEEYGMNGGRRIQFDTKYWRVGLGQEWNDKWSTYLFYYGYKLEWGNADVSPKEFGLGVQYKLNDYTTLGLNYMHADNDANGAASREDNVVKFRTAIEF